MITSHEYEGCGDNECPFCNGEPKCHHDDRQTGTLIDLCGLDRKQHHRRMRVVQLEVRDDGKVYKKENQTMNNPTFVVRSQGEYVAGISDGHFTVTLTMNRTWVTKDVFEEIMTKVAQSLMGVKRSINGSPPSESELTLPFGGYMDKAFVGAYIPKDMKVALIQLANEEKTTIADSLRDSVKQALESRK